MNIDQLTELVLAADRQALCAALAPLDEAQRADLFPEALRLNLTVEDQYGPGMTPAELNEKGYANWRCPRWTAALMLLALGDDKFLRNPYETGCGWLGSDLRDMPHRVLQVLDDRRPPWLADFIRREVKQEMPMIGWLVEFGLMRNGAIPEVVSEDFYRRMAMAPLMSEHFNSDAVKYDDLPKRPKSLAEYIKTEPDILNKHLFCLFEYDAGAFNYSHSPWFEAFKTLCDEEVIDRGRLLAVTASALSRPSRPKELSGYGKLHESLGPSVDEREALVDDYYAALNSDQPAIVGWGLADVEPLVKAKKTDGAELLRHCDNVMRVPQKAQPIKAIKLIRTLTKRQPKLAAPASEVLAIAAGHQRADVQEAAIKELAGLTADFTSTTLERLHDAAGSVASVVKPKLMELLQDSDSSRQGDASEQPRSTEKSSAEKSSGSGDRRGTSSSQGDVAQIAELNTRLDQLDQDIGVASGASAAVRAIDDGPSSFSVDLRPGDVPRCDPKLAVAPLESLEELIDTVASVIERVDDAMDIERILDGLARFGRDRPEDFDKRVAPLRRRIEKLAEPYSRSVVDRGAKFGFSQLLAIWLDMQPIPQDVDSWTDVDGMFFLQRCEEISEQWRMKEEPRRLLALPTHRGGWIDPETLVERIRTDYIEPRSSTDDADLAQALLRLAPDGRAAALKTLQQLTDGQRVSSLYSGGPALRYALGDEADFTSEQDYPWICRRQSAAMHARLLMEQPDFQPRFPVARASTSDDFRIHIDGPAVDDPSLPERLFILAHSRKNQGQPDIRHPDWLHQLEAMRWPANPQPMLMLGYMDAVFDPDLTWTREAARVVLTASCSESKELRLAATDALIDAMGQVRVCPLLLGRQLFGLGDFLTLKRASEALAAAGQVSELHQRSVFQTLDTFVSHLAAVPKDLHFALTPLLETALQSGEALSQGAADVLKSVKGSSKTAKLSKQLLAVEADSGKQLTIRVQAAMAAVERAERWASLATRTQV